MHNITDELYQNIKDQMTEKEFKDQIKNIQSKYDDLIDEEVAGFLILDKNNRNKESITKIKDLEPGMECTLCCRVIHIGDIRKFNRKNGNFGRVVNLQVTDDTDECNLVLWNKDVGVVENNSIVTGSNIKIINGYIKSGYNGTEINVGRWSLLEFNDIVVKDIKNGSKKDITGELLEIQPTRPFFRDNGDFGFVTNIKIKTNSELKTITVWDKKVKELQNFKIGDNIRIESFDIKKNNENVEIHLNGKGSIKKC